MRTNLNFTNRKSIKSFARFSENKCKRNEEHNLIVKDVQNVADTFVKNGEKAVLENNTIEEAKPVRIARLANEKIEVKWNEEIKCDDVNIIVEWSNDLMTIEHPTKIVADTSVLGETPINIHYYGLAFRAKAVVIR